MRRANENFLIDALIDELDRSIALVAVVPEHVFARAQPGTGSVGAHIRHSLDFLNALLRGVRTGEVNYADRERDPRIENDPRYAERKITAAIESARAFRGIDPGTLLAVRSEVQPEVRHRSSFSREAEFVYSHMIHHHALINERLSGSRIRLPAGFGLAPSTRAYRESFPLAA